MAALLGGSEESALTDHGEVVASLGARAQLPSVESVFRGEDGSISTPATRSSLFTRKPSTIGACSRTSSVRREDVPDVLACMSDMRVFSSVDARDNRSDTAPSREPDYSAMVFDVDALRNTFAAVREAFPPHWKHCLAIKSCPLAFVVEEALDAGLGIEAASFVELYMALALGCPADLIAFDSPAKTYEELEMALARGTLVNANSLHELDRIDAILQRQVGAEGEACRKAARVGIRMNPLIGAGTIAEMSVSVPTSKFAVPATASNIRAVVEAFRRWPWLVALHSHVGSQGLSLGQLTSGIAILCDMADLIDEELGKGRVALLDIGGGLPANYDSDEVLPSFSEYATALRSAAPTLFENTERRVLTEFGRAIVAKTAFTVSTVEYVRNNGHPATAAGECPTDDAVPDGVETHDEGAADATESKLQTSSTPCCHQTLVTHVGADIFLRASYCPGKYCHRLFLHRREGAPLGGASITTDVAGPLCFQGDYVVRGSKLPRASPGDLVVAHDTGANTVSLFSRHCSRRFPSIYGYVRDGEGQILVRLIKEKESVQDVARFWGV